MTDTLSAMARRVGEAVGYSSYCDHGHKRTRRANGCGCRAEAAALVELRRLREACAAVADRSVEAATTALANMYLPHEVWCGWQDVKQDAGAIATAIRALGEPAQGTRT